MTAKAISFKPVVLKAKLRALEEHGRCQTRRPLTQAQVGWFFINDQSSAEDLAPWIKGQRLWIRERARVLEYDGLGRARVRLRYEADGTESDWIEVPERIVTCEPGHCIANGVFREGARHFLEVVEVRAELLHAISENDAILEGFASREDFKRAWNTLYQKREQRWLEGASELSPWCWVYTLKRADL